MNNFELISIFDSSHEVINMSVNDISHEESLVSPPAGGNSINWVLGHMIFHRDVTREILGLEKLYGGSLEQYARGSGQLQPAKAIEFSRLIEMYNSGHKALTEKLKNTDLIPDAEKRETVTTLAFHEAYHVGQVGILRRVIGKEGAIK
ncbi:MAG: hypothetical protein UZ05_CHB002003052 [Chlorobi bacterium OLB5]|nr:MAG: hypothetical protein UZ05_CHB002003052 [Chlorobi bacterium OLB5]